MFGYEGSIQITDLSAVPSVGALLGSRGNAELLQAINRNLGSTSFFGSTDDKYAAQHRSFIQRFIDPIREANRQIVNLSTRLVSADMYKPLLTPEDLRNCPPCMMVPILTYQPVYTLLKQGRISGWGYEPENLTDAVEQFDRLIDTNGVINYGIDKPNSDNEYRDVDVFVYGIDPDITFEDRCAIEETREYVDKILNESELDPTDIDYLRG